MDRRLRGERVPPDGGTRRSKLGPTFVSDRLGGDESFTEPYDLAHDAPRLAAGTCEFWRIVRAKRDGADDTREGDADHAGGANDTHKFEFTIAIESA